MTEYAETREPSEAVVKAARAVVRSTITAYCGYHTDAAELARRIVARLDHEGFLIRTPLAFDGPGAQS